MSDRVIGFVHGLSFGDIPAAVVAQARRCLLDLCAVAVAGSTTPMSRIIREHATGNLASTDGGARLLLDGRRASPVGAAMAGAATIDSLDGHDGHALTKGHVGAAVLPTLLAFSDGHDPDGAEFLTALLVGYEVGIRAGIALHATAADYHASGAWNALGCAAVGARVRALGSEQTAHALGIAEYHGPRSQMMRCIEHPTMVKDGSAWGAAAGASAALLAAGGFTGAPAATVTDVAWPWSDLGSRWRILEQYLKPYPVCRWAHPAVRAAIDLVTAHDLRPADIRSVEVTTFHEGSRLITRAPANTEQAQYSLPYAVAIALARRTIAATHLDPADQADPETSRLASTMLVQEDPRLSQRFPAERLARVSLRLYDGRTLESPDTSAPGTPDDPLPDAELGAKFLGLTDGLLGAARRQRLERQISALPRLTSTAALFDDLLAPPDLPSGAQHAQTEARRPASSAVRLGSSATSTYS